MDARLLKIRNERQLVSVMNRTKWQELCHAMSTTLDLDPEVRYKCIDAEQIFGFSTVWWDELFTLSTAIEWLDFDPVKRTHRGRLVADHCVDQSKEIQGILQSLNIPFSIESPYLRVWAYFNVGQHPDFI